MSSALGLALTNSLTRLVPPRLGATEEATAEAKATRETAVMRRQMRDREDSFSTLLWTSRTFLQITTYEAQIRSSSAERNGTHIEITKAFGVEEWKAVGKFMAAI